MGQKTRSQPGGGVLISGASSGLGRSVAIELARKGYTVFAGVRTTEAAESLKQECDEVVPVMLDVRYQDSVDNCLELVKKTLQEKNEKLVALVNNAGVGKGMPIEFVNMEEVEDTFNVNVFGVFRLYRACVPLLRETGPGARIVNTSSLAGLMTTQGGTIYNATKHAVESISDGSRLELLPFGIKVITINPGFMRTGIVDKLETEYKELSQEQKDLYPNFFTAIKEVKRILPDATKVSEGPAEAVVHAITSPRPKRRYIVGRVGDCPAKWMAYFKWFTSPACFDRMSSKPL